MSNYNSLELKSTHVEHPRRCMRAALKPSQWCIFKEKYAPGLSACDLAAPSSQLVNLQRMWLGFNGFISVGQDPESHSCVQRASAHKLLIFPSDSCPTTCRVPGEEPAPTFGGLFRGWGGEGTCCQMGEQKGLLRSTLCLSHPIVTLIECIEFSYKKACFGLLPSCVSESWLE